MLPQKSPESACGAGCRRTADEAISETACLPRANGASGDVQRWAKLNDRQLTVLRQIGDGHEPVTAKTPELANTVYALRGRGLVTTPRKDGIWHAEITDAGRFYLQHGHHPDMPTPDDAGQVAVAHQRRSPEPRHAPGRSPIQLAKDLIKRLQDNDGSLQIETPDDETRASYRRAIHAAKQHGLVPAGFHLRHTGRNAGDLIIQLVDDAHPDETDWNRVRLGARDKVTDAGALVEMLRENPEVLPVSEALMPRALELIRSLAEQARSRGHKLAMSKKRKSRGLHVQVRKRQYAIAIKEEYEQVPREAPPEGRRRQRYAWERVPIKYESAPSGRLRVELSQSRDEQRDHWTDTARTQVESKVREIIKEIEHRADADDQAALEFKRQQEQWRVEEERREAAERASWEKAMAQARTRALADHRNKTFADALDAWAEADEIREFCGALERAAAECRDEDEAARLQPWIEWGRSLADRLDPTRSPCRLAQAGFDREPEADELRPHLGDWSPYGPHKEYYRPQTERREPISDTYREGWRHGPRGRSQWWRR